MRGNLFLVIVFLCNITLFSQQNPEISVLFLGNSLTNGNSTNIDDPSTGNSMAFYFRELAEAAGYNVHVEMYAPNGKYVYDDPYNSSNIGHCNSSVTESYINSRDWDYIVVQDNPGSYMWGEGYISSDVGNSNIQLHNKIIANNSCTKEIFYATQGYYDGLPSDYWHSGGLNLDYDDNIQSTIRSYRNALYLNNNGMHDIVAPIGLAWNQYCNDGHSKDDLYYDTAHPTHKASYLNGAVVFSVVFKMNPTDVNYDGGFYDAQYLRQIAWQTVSNTTYWAECNMPSITPNVNVNGNTLTTDNTYTSYQWYEVPTQIHGATSNIYSIEHTGMYFVEVTDNDGCKLRSVVNNYDYVTGINNTINTKINIFPNPTSDFVNITSDKNYNVIEITNLNGKMVKSFTSNEKNININLKDLPKGVYFIKVNNSVEKLILE